MAKFFFYHPLDSPLPPPPEPGQKHSENASKPPQYPKSANYLTTTY